MLQQDEEALDVEGAGGGGGGGKKKSPPPPLPPINPLRVRAFFVAAVLTVFTSSLVPSPASFSLLLGTWSTPMQGFRSGKTCKLHSSCEERGL